MHTEFLKLSIPSSKSLWKAYGNSLTANYFDTFADDSILEYEVHGKIRSSGAPYDNSFISVVTVENRKIVHWRDYMDSLAAWTALNATL